MTDNPWDDAVSFAALPDSMPLDPNIDQDFGVWHYSASKRSLATSAGGYNYEIDLEGEWTSARMLNWIFQLHSKDWDVPAVVPDLVRAFDEMFHPQRNLCSFGHDMLLPAEFLRRHKT